MAGSQTLFTAVEGVVTQDGVPVVGAQIEQSAKLGAKAPERQETVTDGRGQFVFPEIQLEAGGGRFLPQQFAVGQEILIHHDGKEFVGWILTKFAPEAGTETGEDPIRLVCDLAADQAGGETHVGICRLAEAEG